MKRSLLTLLLLLWCFSASAYAPPPNCTTSGYGLNYSTSTNSYGCVSLGGSGMVYPGVGIANSTGSAWAASLPYGMTGNNTLVETSSGGFIAASIVPTLNQNTSGTAANITATSNSTLTTLSALSLPYSQLSGTVPTWNQNTTGQAGTVATISGLVAQGTNVTITGAGTSASPYTISASGGGGSGTVNSAPQYEIPYYSSAGTTNVLSGHSQLATDSNYDLLITGGLAVGTTSLATGTGVALGYKVVTQGPTVYPANYVSGCSACAYLVLDENASSNDVQLILRDQGNARATFGLAGDDNIHIQTVSGTYLSESFSDRITILGTGSAAPGNVGIGTSNPASLLSVGTNSACQFDYVGNLTCGGTLNAINTGGNAVITANGEKTSGTGAAFRVRNPVDGTIAYFGADSYINGGTAYDQLDIQAAQGNGVVCESGGGLNACGVYVGTNNQIGIGTSTTAGALTVGNASAHAGQTTCWTTSGAIGYCTTAVGISGSCTCTGL